MNDNETKMPRFTDKGRPKDLFGVEIHDTKNPVRGYAGSPGAGPREEFCRTCSHSYCRATTRRYWKCDLVRATCGSGTDIRLKSPACQFWSAKPS